MFDARQSNLRDVSKYAPMRVALTGIWRIVFGALLAAPAGALIYIGPAGEQGTPRQHGDMPAWWLFFVGLVLLVTALGFLAGGVGRIVSAFAGGCYFRAGAEGFAVRLPRQGWFGSFKLTEYQFKWEEIEQLIYFTRRLNLVPVARELHIRVYGGQEIILERYYFSDNIKRILEALSELQARAGRSMGRDGLITVAWE